MNWQDARNNDYVLVFLWVLHNFFLLLNSSEKHYKVGEAKPVSFLIADLKQHLHYSQKSPPDFDLAETIFFIPRQSPGTRSSAEQYSSTQVPFIA